MSSVECDSVSVPLSIALFRSLNAQVREPILSLSGVFAKRCLQVAFVRGFKTTEQIPNGSGGALLEAAPAAARADDKKRNRLQGDLGITAVLHPIETKPAVQNYRSSLFSTSKTATN